MPCPTQIALREAAELQLKAAKAAQSAAEEETGWLRGEMRNHKTSGEKQELSYLRYRVKELEEKNATYNARSNRKFFDVEPLAEENDALRVRIDDLQGNVERLGSIVNPTATLFYSGREVDGKAIGGRRCSDEWAMLSMGLSVLMVSTGNMKPVVEANARFFSINLLTEKRTVTFRKQGKREVRERTLVPSAHNVQDNLELGGEVEDLVTWTEMAEGTSIGLTFDGATINMYGVFGGGVCMVKRDGVVVRRMAFAELMSRETVVNKMRKVQEYFAMGKAALQTLQHPLAHMVDLDRCGASLFDRGGADGVTHRSLEEAVVRRVQYKLGLECWLARDEDARTGALGDIQPSQWEQNGFDEAWAGAQAIFDDHELNEHAIDLEYVARVFDDMSEFFQDYRAAIQLIGYTTRTRTCHPVALFCLEHGQNNTLVAMDAAMDEVAREIIPGLIPDATPKSKAFVEVHKSPANKMMLGFAFGKTFAPCSDKDYGRSFDFEGWERAKYNGTYSLADLQAILGSRFAIFFRNARPLLRAWDHAGEYLTEEKKCETS